MSSKRRFKGWWVICLMAGLGAQPLLAAESGAISRAVEVPPPKGWTPDTPLFQVEEGAPSGGDGRPAHCLEPTTVAVDHASPARRTMREPRPAERLGATKREPVARAKTSSEAPKTRASAAVSARSGERPAVRAQRGDRGAARTAATKRNPARGEVVAASPQRRTSTRVAGRNPTTAAQARSAKTSRAVASVPRAQVDRRKPATRVGGGRASSATLSRARQGAANDPGRSAKARQKTVASAGKVARERTLAQRSAKRAQPGATTGARASSPGVKKG